MGSGVKGPVALVILDGWGIAECTDSNAACRARTPKLSEFFRHFPHTTLNASGMAVGLPEGQMGNSEVGHLNIGAGRIVYQDLTRISKSIADGDFFKNPAFLKTLGEVRRSGGKLHLMGLLSDGGVHSHISHVTALVELARSEGLEDVCIHAFLDGRDTPPKSGAGYIAALEKELSRIGLGRVATVIGRYYAMDRDNRWDRVQKAYRAMTAAEGQVHSSSAEAIAAAYADNQTDEFVEPRVIKTGDSPPGTVDDGDAIIFFNFRSDRAREITRAFTQEEFSGFHREKSPALASFLCMTEYDETFHLPVAYPPAELPNILSTVLARSGKRQLRIAETEKYAHVTFFFNGGNEEPFPLEERVLIPSPTEVATYDQKPEMSAPEVTDEVVRRVQTGRYDFIVLNFANPDMVGHTGIMDAAVRAMEVVDTCVGRVVDAVLKAGGSLLITADHGNCERMVDATGEPHTAHTSDPVPCLLIESGHRDRRLREGILADIAPTVLELLGLPKPSEMTGSSLIIVS